MIKIIFTAICFMMAIVLFFDSKREYKRRKYVDAICALFFMVIFGTFGCWLLWAVLNPELLP